MLKRGWLLHVVLLVSLTLFSCSDVSTDPMVGARSSMKERSPVRMVATDQAGFHVSGW